MRDRGWPSGCAPAGRGPGARWRLMPLLVLRVRAEEQRREELGRALLSLRDAETEAGLRQRALARREDVATSRDVAFGPELAGGVRHLDRLRRETAEAMERARDAGSAAAEARLRHQRARAARESLERERGRWLEERRRAGEARVEGEVYDLIARSRR